jgi:hypothetical protein
MHIFGAFAAERNRPPGVLRSAGAARTPDVVGKFTREAAATLLRFAKSTSDPKLAAALVEKAADMNERLEDSSLSTKDRKRSPPDGESDR